MIVAHDLFAETNPAFGACVAVSFCRHYSLSAAQAPSIALYYLALPIAMSCDTQKSFEETNKKTGLLAWLNRYPDLRLNLGSRLDSSLYIVSKSLKLGLISNALVLEDEGRLKLGLGAPTSSHLNSLPSEPRKVVRRAERLGIWMSEAGTAGSIYSAFGVTL